MRYRVVFRLPAPVRIGPCKLKFPTAAWNFSDAITKLDFDSAEKEELDPEPSDPQWTSEAEFSLYTGKNHRSRHLGTSENCYEEYPFEDALH